MIRLLPLTRLTDKLNIELSRLRVSVTIETGVSFVSVCCHAHSTQLLGSDTGIAEPSDCPFAFARDNLSSCRALQLRSLVLHHSSLARKASSAELSKGR